MQIPYALKLFEDENFVDFVVSQKNLHLKICLAVAIQFNAALLQSTEILSQDLLFQNFNFLDVT